MGSTRFGIQWLGAVDAWASLQQGPEPHHTSPLSSRLSKVVMVQTILVGLRSQLPCWSPTHMPDVPALCMLAPFELPFCNHRFCRLAV